MPTEARQAASAGAWEVRVGDRSAHRAPRHRPIRIASLMGYVDPLGVRPGEVLRVHLSAPAAHEIAVGRLGRGALLLPEPDDAADRAEVTWLASASVPSANRHDVHPGSYGVAGGAPVGRPMTVSAWVRVWHLPATVETSSWAAVVSDLDYPNRCGWAIGVDADGHPGCYLGDGDHHDRANWTFSGSSLLHRLGEWVHLAFTVDGDRVRLWVDGTVAAEGTAAPAGPPGTVRVAAAAQSGLVDHLLDGDVSDVALFSRTLTRHEVVALTEDRAMSKAVPVASAALLAHWPLREIAGSTAADVSGHDRHLTLVNTPTLNIPGPPASSAIGRPGYDPDTDPTRGGSIRFSSDDLVDCGWPTAAEVLVPPDADSGTYYVRVTLAGADDDPLELPFVVVRPVPRRPRSVALLYATFTWTTYARRSTDGVNIPGLASSAYTRNISGRLFFNLGMKLPMPRVRPFRHPSHLCDATVHQHLVRPERHAESWLASEGYAYECITDAELDADPGLLEEFSALMIVGHNEYWTQRMRDGVEEYLSGGGNVLCFSGNTAFWRVGYDQDTKVIETRKTTHPGEGTGVAWLPPQEWGERWHTDGRPGGKWSYLGQAPSELLGLETLGWVDSGDRTAFAPFTVTAPEHFLLHHPDPVPLEPGGLIGTRSHDGPAVSGYEVDGLPEVQGMPALDPKGLTVLAHADHGPRFVAHWGADSGHGADLIYWERPAGGRVLNAGATNYPGALAVDPGLQVLTRNVLHHMGIGKD
ncbi:MAG TPA: N,N-dimethylformamidase beta subunit family domain-containing protein [Actinophytocola sp.]|uniref:N,N-dimethylformamidase beta subunit family domain-containing protein n=1 Tax=Actinophytocola sp. TaxID=1872138 RepID=UPI002DB84542|nr:N,N-dimethylformamidase beta subunit family domain-containing protein [Actinophytocola sp.]HEU5474344.1 N,N-dimethylformamidase beta subunit family domain-containing protein [Actinophytocola sp.]